MKVYKDKTGLFYYKKRKVNGKIVKKKIRIRMKTKQKQTQRQSQKVIINNIIGKVSKTKRRRKKQGPTVSRHKEQEYIENVKAGIRRLQEKNDNSSRPVSDAKILEEAVAKGFAKTFPDLHPDENIEDYLPVKPKPRSVISDRSSSSGSSVKTNNITFHRGPSLDGSVEPDTSYPRLLPKKSFRISDVSPIPKKDGKEREKKVRDKPNKTIGDVMTKFVFTQKQLEKVGIHKPSKFPNMEQFKYHIIKKLHEVDLPQHKLNEWSKTENRRSDLYKEQRSDALKLIAKHEKKIYEGLTKPKGPTSKPSKPKQAPVEEEVKSEAAPSESGSSEAASSEGGKGSGKGEGIDNISINRDMKKYRVPGFCGCYMSDELKYLQKNKKTFCFIYNTDTSKGKGIHWIAINVTKKSLEYYDPLAGRLRKGFLDSMSKVLRRNGIGELKLKVNAVRDQRANSDSCGFFSTKFLIDRARDKSFSKASGYSSISKAEKAVGFFRKKFNKYV